MRKFKFTESQIVSILKQREAGAKCHRHPFWAKPLCMSSLRFHYQRYRHGSNAFLAAYEAKLFVGGGFDADLVGGGAGHGSTDGRLHGSHVRIDLRGLGHHGCVHITEYIAAVQHKLVAMAEQFNAGDAPVALVGIREVFADVAQGKRS